VDVLRDAQPARQFDLVYGSGCFHHIAPHRRITYFECVPPTERPGGRFGIAPLHAIELRAVHSDCEGAFGDFLNAGR
jgi:cyclopropane fatty-acyl-phospholipid synthase-like methyltransferase